MDLDRQHPQARLEGERKRVQALLNELRARLDLADPSESPELTEQDAADIAIDTVERQKDLAILEQLEGEQAEIDAALQRAADGTYGLDEVTGEPIDPARLEALPTARTNVDVRSDRRRETAATIDPSPR
jgi:DnaK suppressor protein